LINALISPGDQLLPSGGVGPLTGAPARIIYARRPVLRVRYRGRSWLRDVVRRMRAPRPGLSAMELGQLSLACSGDQYLMRDTEWLEAALRFALHPEVATAPDETATTLEALHRLNRALAHDASEVSWEGRSAGTAVRNDHRRLAFERAPRRSYVGRPSGTRHESR
jgi:hypothetical protein